MRLSVLIVLAILAAACEPAARSLDRPAAQRPSYELATNAAYDIAAIEAYAADHTAVYEYIDANLDGHLAAQQLGRGS